MCAQEVHNYFQYSPAQNIIKKMHSSTEKYEFYIFHFLQHFSLMLKEDPCERSICLWPTKLLCMQSTNRLGPPISFMKCGRKPQCEAGQVSVCVLKCLAFKASVFPENKLELAIQ